MSLELQLSSFRKPVSIDSRRTAHCCVHIVSREGSRIRAAIARHCRKLLLSRHECTECAGLRWTLGLKSSDIFRQRPQSRRRVAMASARLLKCTLHQPMTNGISDVVEDNLAGRTRRPRSTVQALGALFAWRCASTNGRIQILVILRGCCDGTGVGGADEERHTTSRRIAPSYHDHRNLIRAQTNPRRRGAFRVIDV